MSTASKPVTIAAIVKALNARLAIRTKHVVITMCRGTITMFAVKAPDCQYTMTLADVYKSVLYWREQEIDFWLSPEYRM